MLKSYNISFCIFVLEMSSEVGTDTTYSSDLWTKICVSINFDSWPQ